jgi:hypothetical protein
LPKPAWIAVIAVTFIGGAIAWLILRSPVRGSAAAPPRPVPEPVPPLEANASDGDGYLLSELWTDADDALARHPAGRARSTDTARTTPKGPDDDLDFLRALDRVIRGNFQAGEEV